MRHCRKINIVVRYDSNIAAVIWWILLTKWRQLCKAGYNLLCANGSGYGWGNEHQTFYRWHCRDSRPTLDSATAAAAGCGASSHTPTTHVCRSTITDPIANLYVCITTTVNQTQPNPNPNPNHNRYTKQHKLAANLLQTRVLVYSDTFAWGSVSYCTFIITFYQGKLRRLLLSSYFVPGLQKPAGQGLRSH